MIYNQSWRKKWEIWTKCSLHFLESFIIMFSLRLFKNRYSINFSHLSSLYSWENGDEKNIYIEVKRRYRLRTSLQEMPVIMFQLKFSNESRKWLQTEPRERTGWTFDRAMELFQDELMSQNHVTSSTSPLSYGTDACNKVMFMIEC